MHILHRPPQLLLLTHNDKGILNNSETACQECFGLGPYREVLVANHCSGLEFSGLPRKVLLFLHTHFARGVCVCVGLVVERSGLF